MSRAAAAPDLSPPWLARAFLALAAVTYGLLVFGATVRVHGAGLSCPDWPLCHGKVVPVLDFQVFLEWGHRALASVVSFGFLGGAFLVFRRADLRARVGRLLGVAALALAAQVVLGGLTVLKLLAFWSVTLHLLTGNLFCNLLLLTGLRLGGSSTSVPDSVPGRVRVVGGLLLGAVVLQIALGGLVSSNYAGLACTEWPTCNGGVWFPVLDGIIGLQLAHRLGAYTVLAVAGAFFYVTRSVPALRGAGAAILGLVLAQALLGITNVLLALPVELAIAHSALADLVLLATTRALWAVWAHPVRHPAPVMPVLGSPERA
jgi:cytochrome c oxidase assembly protein subunit 15